MWLIFECLEFLEKRDRLRLNLESRIHAIGWSGFYSAFGGSVSYTDLLPFPDQVANADSEPISDKTIATIRKLHNLDLIPKHVLIAIAQVSPKVAMIMQGAKSYA